jgi:hypothetical protein
MDSKEPKGKKEITWAEVSNIFMLTVIFGMSVGLGISFGFKLFFG